MQILDSHNLCYSIHEENTKNKSQYNGMQIQSGYGKAPVKIRHVMPKKAMILQAPGRIKGKSLKNQDPSGPSLHHLYNFQRELLSVASIVLGEKDLVLQSMEKQMEWAEFKADRPATKKEEIAAKMLKENLIDLIAVRYQQQNRLRFKEAHLAAEADFKQARINYFSSQSWQTISNTFTHNGHNYNQTQLPATKMKIGEKDIFSNAYLGKGVCCWDSTNTKHVTNLWQSIVSTNERGREKRLFSGIRHGVLSPYGVKDPQLRQIGAQNRAKEVLTAALFSKPVLLTKALQGEEVSLKLVSVGLLTASNLFINEGSMVKDQMQAWQSLTRQGKIIHLNIRNEKGELQTVKIKPEIAAFNVGVNELALKFGLGCKASDKYNASALQQLLGDDLRAEAEAGGWVGDWLKNCPDNTETVKTLTQQIKHIWNKKLHHKDGGEPYKLAQRVAMLAYEIGAVPAWNCKSGKDRTGMMDTEIRREVISLHQSNTLTSPDAALSAKQQHLLQKLLLNSGNLEIQKQNTGGAGNKILKELSLTSLNLSYKKRIGNIKTWTFAKGLSSLVSS